MLVDTNNDDSDDNFSEIDDAEQHTEGLHTLLDEPEPSSDHVFTFAPGEGQTPMGLFKDPLAEYLAFPTIFAGQTRPPNSERFKPVHYSDICKWELRAIDRRVAQNIPNILYKMKVLQTKQLYLYHFGLKQMMNRKQEENRL